MAEEQLTLLDNMSPSLRRIYQELNNTAKEMQRVKASTKQLEDALSSIQKVTPTSRLRQSIRDNRQELRQLQRDLKETQRLATQLTPQQRYYNRGLSTGRQAGIIFSTPEGQIYDPDMIINKRGAARNGLRRPSIMTDIDVQNYGKYLENAQLRRNRMIFNGGRLVNGLTFEQRLLRQQHPIRFALGGFDQRMRVLHPRLRGLTDELGVMGGRFSNLGTTLAATIGSLWIFNSIIRSVGDVMNNMFIKPQSEYVGNITRVALTSDGKTTPDQMMDQLYDTASRTRAPADATIALYNRIALSGVKASNERIRRFVESFNKVTAISGTTGQENRAVMLQLAQGIGSNRLGGDEFRSISEQAPLFKYMLARGLGVNPGELKQMGADGKLTAEAILSAMEKVQDQIDQIFKDAPLTIEQTVTIMQNQWAKLINDQLTGYLAIRDVLKDISTWMDTPQGQKIITQMINHWNTFMMNIASITRQIFPVVIKFLDKMLQAGISLMPPITAFISWVLNHINQIITVLKIVVPIIVLIQGAILALKGIIAGMGIYLMLVNVLEILKDIRLLIMSTAPAFLTWLGPISAIVVALGGAILAARTLNAELDPKHIHQTRREKDTIFNYQRDMNAYINKTWPKRAYMTSQGHAVKLTKEQQDADALNDQQRARAFQMGQYALYKVREDMKFGVYRKFNPKDIEGFALNGIKGMADSSKNVEMPPEVKKGKLKGGHLDSVGRIDDKVSIDNDGIEMMKMIAERQWIMQNEVTVPQTVAIKVTKEADISEESMLASLTNGMKTAVASSMRSAAV